VKQMWIAALAAQRVRGRPEARSPPVPWITAAVCSTALPTARTAPLPDSAADTCFGTPRTRAIARTAPLPPSSAAACWASLTIGEGRTVPAPEIWAAAASSRVVVARAAPAPWICAAAGWVTLFGALEARSPPAPAITAVAW